MFKVRAALFLALVVQVAGTTEAIWPWSSGLEDRLEGDWVRVDRDGNPGHPADSQSWPETREEAHRRGLGEDLIPEVFRRYCTRVTELYTFRGGKIYLTRNGFVWASYRILGDDSVLMTRKAGAERVFRVEFRALDQMWWYSGGSASRVEYRWRKLKSK